MLIFTNRFFDTSKSNEEALLKSFEPFTDVLRSCMAAETSQGQWQVNNFSDNISDNDAIRQIATVLDDEKPVLIFLHGNNTAPAGCFTRCKELEEQYKVSVIGYSWESQGFLPDGRKSAEIENEKTQKKGENWEEELAGIQTKESMDAGWIQKKAHRYGQAKLNAQQSRNSLARFLRLIAAARLATKNKKLSFAAFSLGCNFLKEAIKEQDAEASLGVMHNVILLSACTSALGHAKWAEQIHPLQRTYITFNKADSVLLGASIVDKDIKLGANPGVDRASGTKFRYIDFAGAKNMKIGGHRYFVADPKKKLSKQATLLFTRIFRSEEDFINRGDVADSKEVYPVGCAVDGSVCYMGSSSPGNEAG